jgi:hypothetical protein
VTLSKSHLCHVGTNSPLGINMEMNDVNSNSKNVVPSNLNHVGF